MGGSFSGDPADPGRRVLRAFDIQTGKADVGASPDRRRAVVSAACSARRAGVVLYGADDGGFAAADAGNGQAAVALPRAASRRTPRP